MKNVEPLATLRSARLLAVVLAMSFGVAVEAAQTDIASTPIITTTAALVKPNIMLLMDASGSMARTHMPDEMETVTRPESIGYKSSQCNALYYSPTQQYFLPKRSDGTNFPAPAFGSAPYAGFGSYFAVPDLTTTDLNSQFVAYDNNTLENSPLNADTPQAAYYYVYAGAQTLDYTKDVCKQAVPVPDIGGTFAATGGGTWTKVIVSSLSAAEKQNFAIWYSYYRTRVSLIKSAASLAFAPLNDTKRVGFITVQPKDTPGSATINPIRYLPIGDFNSGQKSLWFSKLFSQAPGGASPAREGLARVGRYYGGKDDGINAGMPASGADDPVQYACQQNFAIMTTDGYWNGQTESTNVLGGGVDLLGTTKVGQQDGDPTCPLSDPFCPRPIWDGVSGSIHKVTNKTNAYTDNTCSLASMYRTTYQTQRQVSTTTRDTSRTTKQVIQYYETKSQAIATTTQTTYTQTYDHRSTAQYVKRYTHFTEEKYHHVKWQEHTTKTTEQWQLQTTQVEAQTFQTREVKKHTWQTQEQYTTAKSQSVQTTTQYVMEKDQYKYGVKQILRRQYQLIAYDHSNESGSSVSGTCTPSPGNYPIECRIRDYATGDYVADAAAVTAQLVDPASCTTGPGESIGGFPTYLRTTCTNGPLAQAYGIVSSCTPGFTAASSTNGWQEITCDKSVIDPATPFNGTCTPGTTLGGSPDFFSFVCTRPAGNNHSEPVASCGATTPGTSPDWIAVTCGQPPGPNNFAATPSLPCTPGTTTTVDGTYVTTVCVKSIDTAGWVASCVANLGTTAPYIKTTCGAPVTISDTPMASASCVASTIADVVTTCPKTAAGAYPAPTPVDTCANGSSTGTPNYYETTCTNPAGVNNQTKFVLAGSCTPGLTAGVTPNWVTSNCTQPPGVNNQTTDADPLTCVGNPGTTGPAFLKVTCTTADDGQDAGGAGGLPARAAGHVQRHQQLGCDALREGIGDGSDRRRDLRCPRRSDHSSLHRRLVRPGVARRPGRLVRPRSAAQRGHRHRRVRLHHDGADAGRELHGGDRSRPDVAHGDLRPHADHHCSGGGPSVRVLWRTVPLPDLHPDLCDESGRPLSDGNAGRRLCGWNRRRIHHHDLRLSGGQQLLERRGRALHARHDDRWSHAGQDDVREERHRSALRADVGLPGEHRADRHRPGDDLHDHLGVGAARLDLRGQRRRPRPVL